MATPDAGVSRSVFVGRETELEVMAGALESARASDPRIVWIEGEAGIGKTAFLRRFLTGLEHVTVLHASGEESEITLDYGVAMQLLAQAAPTLSWTTLEEQLRKRAPASAFAVGADLLEAFGAAQDRAPAVIVVDDAHWIDPPSAGALLFALRRLHGDRALVLIASRPEGVAHLGPSWSRLLDDPGRARRIELIGLDALHVGELAESLGAGQLSAAAGARLTQHTGGHPLYVKALLSELPTERLNHLDSELPAPHSFSATVIARLTKLSVDAQDLVAAAAVAGQRCELGLAATVAGIADPLRAVEEALAAELLSLGFTRLPREIEFPHPLMRAAVYDDLSASRRHALHIAWAQLSAEPLSLAHRVAASDGGDDELAAELRRTAEAEIAAYRLTAGIERLMWTSRIAASAQERERALLRAVECQVLAGDIPGANSNLDAVLGCSDSPRRTFTIGVLTAAAGRVSEAEVSFREVIGRPDYDRDPELAGPVTSTLALVCALQGHAEDAIEWSRRALEVPGRHRQRR